MPSSPLTPCSSGIEQRLANVIPYCFGRRSRAHLAGGSDTLNPSYPSVRQADLDAARVVAARQHVAHGARDGAARRLVLLEDDVDASARDDVAGRWYAGMVVVVALHVVVGGPRAG